MDTFARSLLIAERILNDSDYLKIRKERYSSFEIGDGALFEKGKLNIEQLRDIAISSGEPEMISGRQEYFEMLINNYI